MIVAELVECPQCKGSGSTSMPDDCGVCKGEGEITPRHRLLLLLADGFCTWQRAPRKGRRAEYDYVADAVLGEHVVVPAVLLRNVSKWSHVHGSPYTGGCGINSRDTNPSCDCGLDELRKLLGFTS